VYAEVGSIALPRFVQTWLKNSRGQFTVAEVGMLSVMLLMFENQQSLFIGGRFETIEGRASVDPS
jgi:hypothetical protein